jgi:hypothetical protein
MFNFTETSLTWLFSILKCSYYILTFIALNPLISNIKLRKTFHHKSYLQFQELYGFNRETVNIFKKFNMKVSAWRRQKPCALTRLWLLILGLWRWGTSRLSCYGLLQVSHKLIFLCLTCKTEVGNLVLQPYQQWC